MKTLGFVMLIAPFIAVALYLIWLTIATLIRRLLLAAAPTDAETRAAVWAVVLMLWYGTAFTLVYVG